MKEVQIGRVEQVPFESFTQSPISLVPKHEPGQTRLIFHLSYPEGNSVNAHTPKELCSVKYKDLDCAMQLIQSYGQGCYVGKSDFKSTFRNLPIKPEDHKWLIMAVKHLVSKKLSYFIDKCLPFLLTFPKGVQCHWAHLSPVVWTQCQQLLGWFPSDSNVEGNLWWQHWQIFETVCRDQFSGINR